MNEQRILETLTHSSCGLSARQLAGMLMADVDDVIDALLCMAAAGYVEAHRAYLGREIGYKLTCYGYERLLELEGRGDRQWA